MQLFWVQAEPHGYGLGACLVAAETADQAKALVLAQLGNPSWHVVLCEEVDPAPMGSGVLKQAVYEE